MTSQVRTAWLSFIITLSGILTVTAYADADGGCFQGTYFVRESSGTQSLWTFSQDGTYQSASSAEVARSFGHIQGAWKKTGARELRSTGLAFTFSDGNRDVGVPPLRTARVDAVTLFTNKCEEVEGTFEVASLARTTIPSRSPASSFFPTPLPGGVSRLISFAASAVRCWKQANHIPVTSVWNAIVLPSALRARSVMIDPDEPAALER